MSSREVNLQAWESLADVHAASPDYGFERFAAEPAHLSDVVRFDLPRLGDVTGLRGVHLQCHLGTDTVSLARLGARMTGLDFSPSALAQARRLSGISGTAVEFVEADAYDAVQALGAGAHDLVFTGIGALCWLPDIARWGRVVADLLAPGGRLFLREGHPVLWALDEVHPSGLLVLGHPYREVPEPLEWTETGTYVQTDAELPETTTHTWNHGLGEVTTALLDAGLVLTQLVEHDSVPWEALPGKMEQVELGEWRLAERPERLPHSYTLQARKP